MSLLFYEGFDFSANAESPDPTWAFLDGNGGASPGAWVTGRVDGRAFNNTQYGRKSLGANFATLFAGVAFRRQDGNWPSGGDTSMNFIQFIDTTTRQIEVRFLRGAVSGFRFAIFRGATQLAISADLPISVGTWYYLEAKAVLNGAAGSIEVRLNGAPIAGLTLTGISTISTANAYANVIGFASGAQGGYYSTHMDDAYGVSDAGAAPWNSWLGDVHVETRAVDSDVAVQWIPSTGATNFGVLDDLPMTSADYVSANATGRVDEYGVANLATTPASILAVSMIYNVDKDDAGSRTTQGSVVSGVAVGAGAIRGAEHNLRRTYQEMFTTDPATGAAWTPAAVNALKVRIATIA